MNIVLLGAAGSGKGTISDFLKSEYGLKHISTGEILRNNIKMKTPLGELAARYINDGNLVPDEVVINMIKEIVSGDNSGYIFDGFPRNLNQAQKLDEICKIDLVLSVEVQRDIILKRLSNRRICPKCNLTISIDDAPNGLCPKCNSQLITRDDDKPESIKKRLEIYEAGANILKDYYKNKLFVIDNSGDVKTTMNSVKNVVSGKKTYDM